MRGRSQGCGSGAPKRRKSNRFGDAAEPFLPVVESVDEVDESMPAEG
jgi:hypothetical protein